MAITDTHPPGAAKQPMTALPHQERVADKLEAAPAGQGILANHGTGSGKTFTAINAAKRLKLPILAITPSSLRTNFTKEMDAADNPVKHQVVSYQEALNRINNPEFRALAERSLVVMDEAHNMGQDDSARSKLPSMLPGRKLLLSGTPVRNAPHEIAPLINAAAPGSLPEGQAEFDNKYVHTREVPVGFWGRLRGAKPGVVHVPTNLDHFANAVKGKVDFHENVDRTNFPSFHESIMEVPMTPKQQATYEFVLGKYPALAYKVRHGIPPSKSEAKNMTAFFSGPRQISNHPGEFNSSATDDDAPKFKAAVDEIEKRMGKDKNFRGIAYSNFIEAGMDPMSRELDRRNIPYLKFNGEMNDKEKAEVVKKYNGGDCPVMLISGAGAEGLDLKGTKLMQIMEPHWNEEKIHQVRGRAIRYRSHSHLPEAERHVEVQRFHAVPTMGWLSRLVTKKTPYGHGADEYIHNVAKEKQELNQPFLDVLRRVGSDSGDKKKAAEVAEEIESFLHVEFIKEAISTMQTVANLPRLLTSNRGNRFDDAMHHLSDKLEVPARAIDRSVTRVGKNMVGKVKSLLPYPHDPNAPYQGHTPADANAYGDKMFNSTGIPHVDGLPDFEHPRVKHVMDQVHAGKITMPAEHEGDELAQWYWADDMSQRSRRKTVNVPSFGTQPKLLTLAATNGLKTSSIMSQLYPDDATKRFDYSAEIRDLERGPAQHAADAANQKLEADQKAVDVKQKAIDDQLNREEKEKDRAFKADERVFKAQEREQKIQDREEERIIKIHEQAAHDVELASKGVEIAQKQLDAALKLPGPIVNEAPKVPAMGAQGAKKPAKTAEWTSPANLAVHAQKHGDEFGGQGPYIELEAEVSKNPPPDFQVLNKRCRDDVQNATARCSTAYYSPSLKLIHVRDDRSQKTISLYKRNKSPFPSLAIKPREFFDPISGATQG